MNCFKRRMHLIGMLCLCLTISMLVSCAKQPDTVDIQILATSDLHGMFYPWNYMEDVEYTKGNMAQLATGIAKYRNENTLVIDAGDAIQDNMADVFLDEEIHPVIKAMNLIQYDAWTTGNHDYDYGMDTLKKIIKEQNADVLLANVKDENGNYISSPYAIYEKGGVRIAVIGLVTPNIQKWSGDYLKGYQVMDPVEASKEIIKEIEGQYDILIALAHMDIENEYDVSNSGTRDLSKNCPEYDLIISSHAHKQIDGEEINGILTVENKNYAQTFSKINLTLEKDGDSYQIVNKNSEIIDVSQFEADETLLEELKPYHEKGIEKSHEVIGKVEGGTLTSKNEIEFIPQTQIEDTALADLIQKVQLYYSGADVSATAMTTLNSEFNGNDIRYCDTSLIYKYENTLYKLSMTGSQLKKYLEWSAEYYQSYEEGDLSIAFNEEREYYLHDMFEGVNYNIDISKPAGERITDLTWPNGKSVKDTDTLTIAVNNFRANSLLMQPGLVFEENDMPVILEKDIHSDIGSIHDMVIDYIKNVSNGVITPACSNNWKIIGNNWDEELHQKVVEQIKNGQIQIEEVTNNGKNTKKITIDDLK